MIFLDRGRFGVLSLGFGFLGLLSQSMLKNCCADGGYRIFWVMM